MRLVAEVAVSQERPHLRVMVRKVLKTVEVAAQTLLEDPEHQDLPQGHPRTPDRAVHLRLNVFLQQRQQLFAERPVGPDVLKPLQHRRDVVPRLGIEPDLLDGHLTEPELPFVNFPHGTDLAKISPESCRQRENHRPGYDILPIFTT